MNNSDMMCVEMNTEVHWDICDQLFVVRGFSGFLGCSQAKWSNLNGVSEGIIWADGKNETPIWVLVSWSNQTQDQLPKIVQKMNIYSPCFPFFLANDCPPGHHHLPRQHIPWRLFVIWKIIFSAAVSWLLDFFFLSSKSTEVIPRLPSLSPHASLMFLCHCRGSCPEAQPADGAESPAGRGGTCWGAFRGKKGGKKHQQKAPKI